MVSGVTLPLTWVALYHPTCHTACHWKGSVSSQVAHSHSQKWFSVI